MFLQMDPSSHLEKIHGYLLEVFPPLVTKADAAPFLLGDAQVQDYERDGFVSGVPVLEVGQIAELRDRLDHFRNHARDYQEQLHEIEADWLLRPDEVIFHALGLWMLEPLVHDLVFAPMVTVPLAQLLGVERLRLWHDQVFYKPPHHAGLVPWHQDYSYWTRTAPPGHISINIALDDTHLENGCIHYVPGSHRWPLLPTASFGGRMDAVLEHLSAEQRDGFAPVAAPVRAGQATIHHSHTLHGSWGNGSGQPRRALVLNYMAADTRVADGSEPLLAGVPTLDEGTLVEGDHFPIAFDSACLES